MPPLPTALAPAVMSDDRGPFAVRHDDFFTDRADAPSKTRMKDAVRASDRHGDPLADVLKHLQTLEPYDVQQGVISAFSLARPEFATVVRRQSWDWFLELRRRLKVSAEIVDDRATLLLPADGTSPASSLRQLLTSGSHATASAAIAHAIHSNTVVTVTIEGLQIACFSLTGGSASGALLVARGSDALDGPALEAIGSWLRYAAEAHLASTVAESADAMRRVTAVGRLLDQAGAGSEQDVVKAFAEAMAIWEELEVRGYVENVHGQLVLSVDLPGSNRAEAPLAIDGDQVGAEAPLLSLSPSDADRLGFAAPHVCLTRFGPSRDIPWLITFSGELKPDAEARLEAYVNLLGQALRATFASASARTSQALLQQLLLPDDNIERPACAALDQLTKTLQAAGSALMVTTSNGMHVLSVGDDDTFGTASGAAPVTQIATTARLLDRYRMVLAVRRGDNIAFTRREQQLVDIAAALFSAWLPGALRRAAAGQDRRRSARGFDEIIDRFVASTPEDIDVTVLVIHLGDTVLHPMVLQRVVADTRGLLRPSDLAGLLSDTEIALVLSDVSEAHTAGVIARLRHHWEAAPYASALALASIGVASRAAGAPAVGSVARSARERAAHA